jgi:Clp amino terminal domain, pathogenicity island component
VVQQEPSGPYLAAMRRAFDFARQTGGGARGCRPVHFLVGIADGEGPAAAALRPADGRSLRAIVTDMGVAGGSPAGYLHMQAQQGAMSLAAARGEPPGVEHLLVALLDQGTPEVLDALSRAGLDPVAIRRAALAALGAPADLPPLEFEPTTPAGTLDRPALPVTELNTRAWAVLRWRQEHLPIGALRRRCNTWALLNSEHAAVMRVADQLALDDDQRYSLVHHHRQVVGDRIAQARPDLARPNQERNAEARARTLAVMQHGRRYRWLRVTAGWGVWVGNRRVNAQNRWFRLRTAGAYRGAPQP